MIFDKDKKKKSTTPSGEITSPVGATTAEEEAKIDDPNEIVGQDVPQEKKYLSQRDIDDLYREPIKEKTNLSQRDIDELYGPKKPATRVTKKPVSKIATQLQPAPQERVTLQAKPMTDAEYTQERFGVQGRNKIKGLISSGTLDPKKLEEANSYLADLEKRKKEQATNAGKQLGEIKTGVEPRKVTSGLSNVQTESTYYNKTTGAKAVKPQTEFIAPDGRKANRTPEGLELDGKIYQNNEGKWVSTDGSSALDFKQKVLDQDGSEVVDIADRISGRSTLDITHLTGLKGSEFRKALNVEHLNTLGMFSGEAIQLATEALAKYVGDDKLAINLDSGETIDDYLDLNDLVEKDGKFYTKFTDTDAKGLIAGLLVNMATEARELDKTSPEVTPEYIASLLKKTDEYASKTQSDVDKEAQDKIKSLGQDLPDLATTAWSQFWSTMSSIKSALLPESVSRLQQTLGVDVKKGPQDNSDPKLAGLRSSNPLEGKLWQIEDLLKMSQTQKSQSANQAVMDRKDSRLAIALLSPIVPLGSTLINSARRLYSGVKTQSTLDKFGEVVDSSAVGDYVPSSSSLVDMGTTLAVIATADALTGGMASVPTMMAIGHYQLAKSDPKTYLSMQGINLLSMGLGKTMNILPHATGGVVSAKQMAVGNITLALGQTASTALINPDLYKTREGYFDTSRFVREAVLNLSGQGFDIMALAKTNKGVLGSNIMVRGDDGSGVMLLRNPETGLLQSYKVSDTEFESMRKANPDRNFVVKTLSNEDRDAFYTLHNPSLKNRLAVAFGGEYSNFKELNSLSLPVLGEGGKIVSVETKISEDLAKGRMWPLLSVLDSGLPLNSKDIVGDNVAQKSLNILSEADLITVNEDGLVTLSPKGAKELELLNTIRDDIETQSSKFGNQYGRKGAEQAIADNPDNEFIPKYQKNAEDVPLASVADMGAKERDAIAIALATGNGRYEPDTGVYKFGENASKATEILRPTDLPVSAENTAKAKTALNNASINLKDLKAEDFKNNTGEDLPDTIAVLETNGTSEVWNRRNGVFYAGDKALPDSRMKAKLASEWKYFHPDPVQESAGAEPTVTSKPPPAGQQVEGAGAGENTLTTGQIRKNLEGQELEDFSFTQPREFNEDATDAFAPDAFSPKTEDMTTEASSVIEGKFTGPPVGNQRYTDRQIFHNLLGTENPDIASIAKKYGKTEEEVATIYARELDRFERAPIDTALLQGDTKIIAEQVLKALKAFPKASRTEVYNKVVALIKGRIPDADIRTVLTHLNKAKIISESYDTGIFMRSIKSLRPADQKAETQQFGVFRTAVNDLKEFIGLGHTSLKPFDLDVKTHERNRLDYYNGKGVQVDSKTYINLKTFKGFEQSEADPTRFYVDEQTMRDIRTARFGKVDDSIEGFAGDSDAVAQIQAGAPDTDFTKALLKATKGGKSFDVVLLDKSVSYGKLITNSSHERIHTVIMNESGGVRIFGDIEKLASIWATPHGSALNKLIDGSAYGDASLNARSHELLAMASNADTLDLLGVTPENAEIYAKVYADHITALSKEFGGDLVNKISEFTDPRVKELVENANRLEPSTKGRGTSAEEGKKSSGGAGKEEIAIKAKSDGESYFSEEALDNARNQNFKSREKMITMSIDDYLSMAKKLDSPDPYKSSGVKELLSKGTKFSDVPFLQVDRNGKVTGHEGRHRALALKDLGVKEIPVKLISENIRWGNQAEGSFDRVDFPKTMRGEDGNSIPFPVKRDTELTIKANAENKESGEAFDEFFRKTSEGETGKSSKAYIPVMKLPADFKTVFEIQSENRGNFDGHISRSIPAHGEMQTVTAKTVLDVLPKGGKVLDIGGSEGAWGKSITKASDGKIRTEIVDPNTSMEKFFNSKPVEGSTYINKPYMTGWDGVEPHKTVEKADVVHESMVFQFINKNRAEQLDYIIENDLKPDGLFITEEKFLEPAHIWKPNEAVKNEYKSQYFEAKDMDAKSAQVLEGMNKNMISSLEMERLLVSRFKHVGKYWDSGNFKGYLATNDKAKFDTAMKSVGKLGETKYSDSPTGPISPTKFDLIKSVNKLREIEDGFTVDSTGKKLKPKSGYAVAIRPIEDITRVNIGEDSAVGFWRDRDGTAYTDEVKIVEDVAEAIRVGRDNDQIAIWDFANEREIRLNDGELAKRVPKTKEDVQKELESGSGLKNLELMRMTKSGDPTEVNGFGGAELMARKQSKGARPVFNFFVKAGKDYIIEPDFETKKLPRTEVTGTFRLFDTSQDPDNLYREMSFGQFQQRITDLGYDGFYSGHPDIPDFQKFRVSLLDTPQNRAKISGELAIKTNLASFKEARQFADESAFENMSQFKAGLQKRLEESLPYLRKIYGPELDPKQYNEQTRKYMSDHLTDEVVDALATNPEAVGWYDSTLKKAFSTISLLHPEIESDPIARETYILPLAVTSNGNKVAKNLEYADLQYAHFKKTGRFDDQMPAGAQQTGIQKSFKLINSILDSGISMSQLSNFMQAEFRAGDLKFTVGDKVLNFGVGELADERIHGASMLGPKIGNGFYMNLHGDYSKLTMDRWFTRTWKRLNGSLVEKDAGKIAETTSRFKTALKSLDPASKKILKGIVDLAMPVNDLATAVLKASADLNLRDSLNSTSGLSEVRKSSINLVKELTGEMEAPRNGSERKFIRQTFDDVQSNLRSKGIDITMADAQALLWYPEKILYSSFKKGQSYDKASLDYTTDTAPDYANSARDYVKTKGITDEQLSGIGNSGFELRGTRGIGEADSGADQLQRIKEALGRLRGKDELAVKVGHYSPHLFAKEALVQNPDGSTEYVLKGQEGDREIIQEFPNGRFRFDPSTKGSGEGLQAFGDGIYFFTNEAVGAYYKNMSNRKAKTSVPKLSIDGDSKDLDGNIQQLLNSSKNKQAFTEGLDRKIEAGERVIQKRNKELADLDERAKDLMADDNNIITFDNYEIRPSFPIKKDYQSILEASLPNERARALIELDLPSRSFTSKPRFVELMIDNLQNMVTRDFTNEQMSEYVSKGEVEFFKTYSNFKTEALTFLRSMTPDEFRAKFYSEEYEVKGFQSSSYAGIAKSMPEAKDMVLKAYREDLEQDILEGSARLQELKNFDTDRVTERPDFNVNGKPFKMMELPFSIIRHIDGAEGNLKDARKQVKNQIERIESSTGRLQEEIDGIDAKYKEYLEDPDIYEFDSRLRIEPAQLLKENYADQVYKYADTIPSPEAKAVIASFVPRSYTGSDTFLFGVKNSIEYALASKLDTSERDALSRNPSKFIESSKEPEAEALRYLDSIAPEDFAGIYYDKAYSIFLGKDGTKFTANMKEAKEIAVASHKKQLTEDLADWKKELQELKDFDNAEIEDLRPRGRRYNTNLEIEDHEFLDWDNNQSGHVLKQLRQMATFIHQDSMKAPKSYGVVAGKDRLLSSLYFDLNDLITRAEYDGDALTGEQVNQIMWSHIGQAKTLEYFQKAGIKALKFLDAMSRKGRNETHNYVLYDFHHDTVQIEEIAMKAKRGNDPEDHQEFAVKSIKIDNSTPELISGDFNAWVDLASRLTRDTLTEQEVENIKSLSDKGDIDGLTKYTAGLTHMKVIDLFTNIIKVNPLLSVRTIARNVMSNIGFSAMEEVARVPASVVDMALAVASSDKKRYVQGASPRYVKAVTLGLIQGIKQGFKTFTTGESQTQTDNPYYARELTTGITLLKPFEIYTKYGFRLQEAIDKPAKRQNEIRALDEAISLKAKNEGISREEARKNLSVEDVGVALEYARFATFQDENWVANKWYQVKENQVGAVRAVMDLTVPYIKTPTNVMYRALDYAGILPVVKAINSEAGRSFGSGEWKKAKQQLVSALDDPEARKAISWGIGRGLIGWSMAVAGYYMAKSGFLQSNYDEKDRKDNTMDDLRGISKGSVLIDGNSYDISSLNPFAFFFLAGADTYRNETREIKTKKNKGEFVDEAKERPTIAGVPTNLANIESLKKLALMTPLVGKSYEWIKDASDGDMDFARLVGAGRAVPSILGEVATTMDGKVRLAGGDGTDTGKMLDNIKERIPYLRETLPEKSDSLGNPVKAPNGFDPFRTRKVTNGVVLDELVRLDVLPTVKLEGTPNDRNNRSKQLGNSILKPLETLIQSKDYQDLDDSQKKSKLSKVIAESKDYIGDVEKLGEKASTITVKLDKIPQFASATPEMKDKIRKEVLDYTERKADVDIPANWLKFNQKMVVMRESYKPRLMKVVEGFSDVKPFDRENYVNNYFERFYVSKVKLAGHALSLYQAFEKDPEKTLVEYYKKGKDIKEKRAKTEGKRAKKYAKYNVDEFIKWDN